MLVVATLRRNQQIDIADAETANLAAFVRPEGVTRRNRTAGDVQVFNLEHAGALGLCVHGEAGGLHFFQVKTGKMELF